MNIDPNNASAESIEEEGEKVTGGATSDNNNNTQENDTATSTATENTEIMPDKETKKEDMTGYNQHPDQEKVGGG